MKVLVLGGTSFFGKEIVSAFCAKGHAVTTFSRVKNPDIHDANHIQGDRTSKDDLLTVANAASWDIVIDNIAFDAKDVAAALDVFKSVKRYVLTSTVSVYRFIPDENYLPPIKESAVVFNYLPKEEEATDTKWKYARGKLEAEKALTKQTVVPWTIIRPPVVYGRNDSTSRGYWYLQRLLDKQPILLSNEWKNDFQLCHSTDLAHAYLLAAETPLAVGKTYNVAMKEVLSLKKFIEISAKALGIAPSFVSVPKAFLQDFGGPYARLENQIYDSSAAFKDFGFIHSPMPAFIENTALWFRDSWHGNKQELLVTREKELQLAKEWLSLSRQERASGFTLQNTKS